MLPEAQGNWSLNATAPVKVSNFDVPANEDSFPNLALAGGLLALVVGSIAGGIALVYISVRPGAIQEPLLACHESVS